MLLIIYYYSFIIIFGHESTKMLIREKALNRGDEFKDKLRKAFSKPVILYNLDLSVYKTFPGLYVMAEYFKCDTRTINKAINNNSLFKKQWYIKFKDTSTETK